MILGGGTGGTMTANRLRRRFEQDEAEIHAVDRDEQMEKIDIPPIPEFIELVADSGARLYACKATVDMFGLTMEDFVPQVDEIISVGEFYEKAAGGQIVFT